KMALSVFKTGFTLTCRPAKAAQPSDCSRPMMGMSGCLHSRSQFSNPQKAGSEASFMLVTYVRLAVNGFYISMPAMDGHGAANESEGRLASRVRRAELGYGKGILFEASVTITEITAGIKGPNTMAMYLPTVAKSKGHSGVFSMTAYRRVTSSIFLFAFSSLALFGFERSSTDLK